MARWKGFGLGMQGWRSWSAVLALAESKGRPGWAEEKKHRSVAETRRGEERGVTFLRRLVGESIARPPRLPKAWLPKRSAVPPARRLR